MRRPPRFVLAAGLVTLTAALGGELAAAPSPAPAVEPVRPAELPYGEARATECVVGGPVVALSVLAYLERAAVVALRGEAEDTTVPVLATGFAFGCGTGDVLAPGLWWMFRYL